ncbi:MAG TPA: D-glycero-beta-D-manno-heptose 1-phosphate adenylyltransferase [Terriglobia bacterium]|nr:D-glycero-beta-D-manno-heptose 1-phosphate adenylyltransferase [Terriglobia bacterium]
MSIDRQSIASLLRRLAGVRLLVAGDFMLDRTLYGDASRISPEAPTPVIRVQQSREHLGGAGNVVRNLDSLGGNIWCVAVTGDDGPADRIEERLRALRGCQEVCVLRERNRRTTLKTRVVAVQPSRGAAATGLFGHHQVLRFDEETCDPVSPQTAAAIREFAARVIRQVDGVVLSDYAKGALPPALVQELIGLGRAHDKPVFVDPKDRNFNRYRGATVLTPNTVEAEAALGIPIESDPRAAELGWERAIQDRLGMWGLEALLITRGPEGLSLIDRRGFQHFPTSAREVFDVTGAGDTVLAAFSLAAAAGVAYADAAQLGNAAAGVAVSKAGAAVVHPFEIEREFDARQFSAEAKIRSREEMQGIAETLRRENKRIVFTNGCFDLLHVGHMYLLREAKKFGDVLVVGLNSDSSVRQLKGDGRPIVPEQDRAEAIAALESVDYLVIFHEPDPLELLRAIRPDVLVKGSDYQPAEVVGAEFLASYGGEVRLVPLREGISTSRLVENIRSRRPPAEAE